MNKVQRKDAAAYSDLLKRAFGECRRVLKPGGRMTVVFHNSSAEVWDALRMALTNAGFSVEGTQTFDKKHGTFKHFVSENAVGYDLVIHCKPGKSAATTSRNTDVRTHVRGFVDKHLNGHRETYTVRFEHVQRAPETDWRRLYAEWLQESLESGLPAMSFADFRRVGAGIVRDRQRAEKQLTH